MKININNNAIPRGTDKTPGASWETQLDRCIEDLLFIQNDKKLYINERKQLQELIYKLHTLEYYAKNKTALDDIGYELIQ